ncbi:MAG: mechanosensitive ion channel domain-containing protein [Polyangiaceae bacterium]
MVLLAVTVPGTLVRWVAFGLILVGIGAFGTARADAPLDARPVPSAASATPAGSTSAEVPALPAPAPTTAEAESGAPNGADGSPAAATSATTISSAPMPVAPAPLPGSSASSGHAAPAGSGAAASGDSVVRLHDQSVFTIKAALGGQNAEARARAAGQTLEHLVEEREPPEVRTEEHADRIVVFGGTTPIVQLGADDATAAGDESLAVHAAGVAAKIRDVLQSERQRKALGETVFSISSLAFSALLAILLLGQVRNLAGKLQAWMTKNPDRLPALRFKGIDLVRPAAFRGGLSVALGIGSVLSQLGIAYVWLLIASSLFESTRTYTERLTGFVLTPLSALIGRIGSALPLLVILATAVLGVWLLLRFVRLFFGSVARGETTLGWLPADLAGPTGALVRFGIVVVALLVAAPLITGNDDGALARAGVATLLALGFASAPVIASIVAGVPIVYARRVRIGDHVEIGGREGRVTYVSLLEVRLEDDLGCTIRVPHLTSLLAPTRVLGHAPIAIVDVVTDPTAPQSHVRAVLLAEARRFGTNVKVDLVRLDAEGAHYRIAARAAPASHADDDLATALASALAREQVALGRSASRRP